LTPVWLREELGVIVRAGAVVEWSGVETLVVALGRCGPLARLRQHVSGREGSIRGKDAETVT